MIYIDDVRLTFCEHLDFKNPYVVDAVLGMVIANEFNTDPISLYLIGPPSVGKTELLNALTGYYRVSPLSTLTPNTFISGIKGKGGSLLLSLGAEKKTILVVKDFTSILEMRAEAKAEIISQIREIMDGSYKKSFGTGKTVSWEGKLAFICGVTTVIYKHHSIHSVLGERFLSFRLEAGENTRMAEKAIAMTGKEKAMRKELRVMTAQFLGQFKNLKIESILIPEEIKMKLIHLVSLVAIGRTGISRDRFSRTVDYLPEPEGTPRLIKQMWTLGCGIAVIQHKNEIDEEVYEILKKVGRDTMPSQRDLILKKMWDLNLHGDKWETTKALARFINCPTPSVRIYLEDMLLVDLLKQRIQGEEDDQDNSWKRTETSPYLWQLSGQCVNLIQQSEIYRSQENGSDSDYDEHFDFEEGAYPLYTKS